MQKVADCLAYGNGTAQDFQQAAVWAQRASDANNAAATVLLGWLYENGRGIQPDPIRAVSLYRKAAGLGDPTGMCDLAVCYENGTGVSSDFAKAYEWYKKAADKGSDVGMYSLGLMNVLGEGIPENDKEAARWFHLAAEKGSSNAITALSFCHLSQSETEDPRNSAILDAVLAPRSDALTGFNEVHLGSSYKELSDQVGGLYFADDSPGCIRTNDEQYFLLSNGKLVAYWRKYRGDNQGWIEKLKDVVGPAQGDDKVFRSSHDWDGTPSENVSAWYDYQNSVVTVDAYWISVGYPQEWVVATLVDREWLRSQQDRDLSRKRELVSWLSGTMSDLDSGKPLPNLTPLSGTSDVLRHNPVDGDMCCFLAKEDVDAHPRMAKRLLPYMPGRSGRTMAMVRELGPAASITLDLGPLPTDTDAGYLEPLTK
jgi:TPR repeat protein